MSVKVLFITHSSPGDPIISKGLPPEEFHISGILPDVHSACELVKADLPDLIVVDIELWPQLEEIQKLTEDCPDKDFAFLLIMDRANPSVEQLVPEGVNVLFSPFSSLELRLAVRAVLHHRATVRNAEGEQKFRRLVEQSPFGILLCDENGRIVEWNQAQAVLTGIPFADIYQKPIWKLLDLLPQQSKEKWKDRPLDIDRYKSSVQKGSLFHQQRWNYELKLPDGSSRPITSVSFPFYTRAGVQMGFISYDVSDVKRAEMEIRRHADQAEALARLASRLKGMLFLEDVLEVTCEEAANTLNAAGSSILLYDERSQQFSIAAAYGSVPEMDVSTLAPVPYELFEKFLGAGNSPLVIPDIQSLPDFLSQNFFIQQDVRTVAISSLIHESRVIGLLGVVSRFEEKEFSADELLLLQAIADQSASAISISQLFWLNQHQSQRLALVNEVTRTAMESGDPAVSLRALADLLVSGMGVAGAFILLWDQERNAPIPVAESGLDEQAFSGLDPLPNPESLARTVLEHGRAVFMPEAVASKMLRPRIKQIVTKDHSLLALPLKQGSDKLGIVFIAFPKNKMMRADEIQQWELLASQISLAVARASLLEQERQRRMEAETLQEVTAALASDLALDHILKDILLYMNRIVPFDSAVILLHEEDHVKTVAFEKLDTLENRFPSVFPLDDPFLIRLDQSDQPLILSAEEFNDEYPILWKISQPDAICWMGIPLIAQRHSIGYLILSNAKDVYSQRYSRLAQSFAKQAAIEIYNAQLFEEIRKGRERLHVLSSQLVEVQEAERRALARELHDEIGQILTGLQFNLEMCKRLSGDPLEQSLSEAQGVVGGIMAQVRELSLNLHPGLLDDLGLVPTLQWHFERYTRQTGIMVDFECQNAEVRFTPEVEITAYRIIQEALTNVARHASVSSVAAFVKVTDQIMFIDIQDDGLGFNLDDVMANKQTSGLTGIVERANLIGGRLHIQSIIGQGTHLFAELPLTSRLERRERSR